jgi:hypothetical protein
MNTEYNFDESITTALNDLTTNEIFKSMANAVKKVGRDGQRQIRASYKKTGIKHRENSDYKDPAKGIRFVVAKSNKLNMAFKISDQRNDAKSGAFKLKWVEKGTTNRSTRRRGRNRGKITARPFFAPVINAMQNTILKSYEDAFEASIKRLIEKKRRNRG